MVETPTLILQAKLTALITESFSLNLLQKQDQTKIVIMQGPRSKVKSGRADN